MNRAHLEAKVLSVLDRVRARQPVEDAAVEVKSKWPSPDDAARQICGLCNAARGQPITYIIGADEKAGLVAGCDLIDLATWFPAFGKWFEGLAPELSDDLAVPTQGVTVRVLRFATDRAPYVVKWKGPDGNPTDRLDVLFRGATGTRSAKREELLRMLVPQVRTPELEVVGVSLVDQRSNATRGLELGLQLYVIPRDPSPLGIAVHRIDLQLRNHGRVLSSTFEGVSLALLGRSPSSEVAVTAPTSIRIEGKFRNVEQQREFSNPSISVRIVAAGTGEAAVLDIPLVRGDGNVWGASYESVRAANEAR